MPSGARPKRDGQTDTSCELRQLVVRRMQHTGACPWHETAGRSSATTNRASRGRYSGSRCGPRTTEAGARGGTAPGCKNLKCTHNVQHGFVWVVGTEVDVS